MTSGPRVATRSRALLYAAAEAPLHAASLALAVLELSERVFDASTAALVSDAGCAAEFANAAVLACALQRAHQPPVYEGWGGDRPSERRAKRDRRAGSEDVDAAATAPHGCVGFLDGSVGRGSHRAQDFSGEMPGVFVRLAFNRADVKGKGNVPSAARGHVAGESLLNELVVA